MAITKVIPKLWSAKILTKFRDEAIFAGLANRDYEGEAKKGNTVVIPGIVDVTIKDYKAAGRVTTAEAVTDTAVELVIDQEKVFDFFVDDIDAAQAAPALMSAYTDSAAAGLKEDADSFLAALLVAGGAEVAPLVPATDGKTAWNLIRDIRKALNLAGVPQAGRLLAYNAEFGALLEESDAKLMKANESASTSGLKDASFGRILGFDTYATENTPTSATPQIIGWHKSALAYASQIEKTEPMRADNKFADRLRGLHVYGGKVVRPDAVFHWTGV